jgi:hypothetical protein
MDLDVIHQLGIHRAIIVGNAHKIVERHGSSGRRNMLMQVVGIAIVRW